MKSRRSAVYRAGYATRSRGLSWSAPKAVAAPQVARRQKPMRTGRGARILASRARTSGVQLPLLIALLQPAPAVVASGSLPLVRLEWEAVFEGIEGATTVK